MENIVMTNKKIKVLSLFDGMSVAQQALKKVKAKVETYYASEIDPYAIAVTQSNFPNTIQIGDVKQIEKLVGNENKCSGVFVGRRNIDLLIGGSPCQDLSIAKKGRQGLGGGTLGVILGIRTNTKRS